jgi:hypothetical protein
LQLTAVASACCLQTLGWRLQGSLDLLMLFRSVYVADYTSCRIRKITPIGVVTTFAGNGTAATADGTGTAASFNAPRVSMRGMHAVSTACPLLASIPQCVGMDLFGAASGVECSPHMHGQLQPCCWAVRQLGALSGACPLLATCPSAVSPMGQG